MYFFTMEFPSFLNCNPSLPHLKICVALPMPDNSGENDSLFIETNPQFLRRWHLQIFGPLPCLFSNRFSFFYDANTLIIYGYIQF